MLANKTHKLYAIASVILIVFVAGFVFKETVHDQLQQWDILQKPEQTTELYFSDPSLVPAAYTPAQPIAISFTLHNDRQNVKTYHYTITEYNEAGNTRQELHTGSLTLQPNEKKRTNVRVLPVDFGTNAKFDIQLTNDMQRINFWATKT